jgi:hypothetical protein
VFKGKIRDLQKALGISVHATSNNAQSGREHFEREWLGEIVIGAYIQASHNIWHRIAGSQHEDGYSNPGNAETPGDIYAIHPGQHDVQQDRIKWQVGRFVESLDTVQGDIHGMTQTDQTTAEKLGHFDIVLNH